MNTSAGALSKRLRRNHESCVYIELHGSTIKDIGDVVDALHLNTTVEFVCFQRLSMEQQRKLLIAVSELPKLQRIYLCNFATTDAYALESMIRNSTNLKELSLECSRLVGSQNDITSLAAAIKAHESLKQVVFRQCFVGADEISKFDPLFDSLSRSSSINELTMDGSKVLLLDTRIEAGGPCPKVEEEEAALNTFVSNSSLYSLCSSSRLTALNLCYISLNDENLIDVMTQGLKKNECLRTFNCTWCQLGDNGAMALAGVLCVNRSLETLHLYNNCIRDAGCEAIASCLSQTKSLTLKGLLIHERGHSRKACGAFLNMLRQNVSLEHLSINCTCFELRSKIDFLLGARQALVHNSNQNHNEYVNNQDPREKLIQFLFSARNDVDCLFSVLFMKPSLWTKEQKGFLE